MKRLRSALAFMVAFATATASPCMANGEPAPGVDVAIHDDVPSPWRRLSIEWNPLPLFTIGKLSANVVVTPVNHHAIVLSPFYTWTSTAPVYIFDNEGNPTELPKQSFKGFGTELGYRYYTGDHGPRGLFLGPSLIVGWLTATAQNGTKTHFTDYGIAADIGYQLLLDDCVAVSLGGGAEYMWTDPSIPAQQFPSRIYANRGVNPRVLASLGWAF
jgi:hypothetical protein